MSNLVHAAVIVLCVWLGNGFIRHIPLAALAGVIAWVGVCLLDWSTWRRLPKMRPADAAAFLTTAVCVLLVNAVAAVAAGCAVYAARHVWLRAGRRTETSGALPETA